MANAFQVVVRSKTGTIYESEIVHQAPGESADEVIAELNEQYSDLSDVAGISFIGLCYKPFQLQHEWINVKANINIMADAIEAIAVIPLTLED